MLSSVLIQSDYFQDHCGLAFEGNSCGAKHRTIGKEDVSFRAHVQVVSEVESM